MAEATADALRLSLEAYPTPQIQWKGAAELPRQLDELVAGYVLTFDQAARALGVTGGLRPNLEIRIVDDRRDQSAPLPAIPGVRGFEVVSAFHQPL